MVFSVAVPPLTLLPAPAEPPPPPELLPTELALLLPCDGEAAGVFPFCPEPFTAPPPLHLLLLQVQQET